jgi:PPOX class probable F420-dependent enzyme
MPTKPDSLALLHTPVAQALLQSTIPARLAYMGRDGTPRVLPIWFHWTGEVFVLGTRLDSAKVKALSTHPTVALTIDTDAFPYQALQVRGTIEMETINGIVPEYELCAKRYLGDKRGMAWLDQLRQAFPPMARIVVRPEWVSILDVAQLYPQVIAAVMSAEED